MWEQGSKGRVDDIWLAGAISKKGKKGKKDKKRAKPGAVIEPMAMPEPEPEPKDDATATGQSAGNRGISGSGSNSTKTGFGASAWSGAAVNGEINLTTSVAFAPHTEAEDRAWQRNQVFPKHPIYGGLQKLVE
jgi:hypothetical protein